MPVKLLEIFLYWYLESVQQWRVVLNESDHLIFTGALCSSITVHVPPTYIGNIIVADLLNVHVSLMQP